MDNSGTPLTPRRAFVLSTWGAGASQGRRMGAHGYSYDFYARLYLPLLRELGEVISVGREPGELENAIRKARQDGLDPIHLSFYPLHLAAFAKSAPNVVALAWEFPDIPNHEFDGNPQNDWPAAAEACDLVMVASHFNRDALVRGGVRTPVQVVPAPVASNYFEMEPWQPHRVTKLDCRAHVFTGRTPDLRPVPIADRTKPRRRLKKRLIGLIRSVTPNRLYRGVAVAFRAVQEELWAPTPPPVPEGNANGIEISGIVYTCVMNPDGRKNWEDVITGFIHTFRDQADVTLVLKIASSEWAKVIPLLDRCRNLGVSHRCKVVAINQFLTDAQMHDLARATTYYLTATRGEGICLPLMDYLAAGRPAVAPLHTALTDYFGPDCGFVVDSHPEPTAFSHDSRLRQLTRWQRIVWSSLSDQLWESYRVAAKQRAVYDALAGRARERLRAWASIEAVRPRLRAALDSVMRANERKRAA